MRTSVRPRRLVHRGVVPASAFLVALEPMGVFRAKRRIVELAGSADVYRVDRGWIVRLRAPVSTAVAGAPGIPFVATERGGRLFSSAPLEEDEVKPLVAGARSGDLFVDVRGGLAEILEPEAVVDASDWLDVEAFEVSDVEPLGALPPPPPAPAIAAARTFRDVLGKAEKPPPELSALVAALRGRDPSPLATPGATELPRSGALARGSSAGLAGGGGGLGALGAVISVVGAFLSIFGGTSSQRGDTGRSGEHTRSGGARAGATRQLASVPQEDVGPSWAERMRSRMLDWVARMLVATRLARVLEKKHAQYLSKMLDLFDRGEIEEALRWAIPLDGESAGGEPADPMFLPPTPRSALDIDLGGLAGGRARSLGLGGSLFDHLKTQYRAAFEKLSAAGRHKDAAFVLVELLNETAEAVSYLERNRELRLAAELAEARKLAPDLVVRQWMIAGDTPRAIAIARRFDAFATAIQRLEAHEKEQAAALRLLWADVLAASGAFAAAVEAVWPVEGARRLALRWLDHAVDVGGVVGAKMLARKASLVDGAFPEVRDRTLALLADAGSAGPALRAAFADELLKVSVTPAVRVLARQAARAIAPDGIAWRPGALATLADDAVLHAELAASPMVVVPSPARSDEPIVRHLADRGAVSALDAALLPDGSILVALGEGGTRIVRPDGRTIGRFLEPAYRIVISDHGTRAILLAPRGKGVWRVSRLDLLGRRVRPWLDARLDAFAADFDGSTWLVAGGAAIHAIDVLDDAWNALWSTTEPGTTTRAITRDPSWIAVLRARALAGGLTYEVYTYDVKGPALRQRRTVEAHVPFGIVGPPSPLGSVAAVFESETSASVSVFDNDGLRTGAERAGVFALGAPDPDGRTLSFERRREPAAGIVVALVSTAPALEIELRGASEANARRCGDRILVWDDRGRILLCSILARRALCEWRLA